MGLALALGTRAPVLLLDEPLASLDPLARREFLHVLVDAVRADGPTALLSSHVITDIEQACDRLIVLGGGRTLLDVSIAEAIAGHRVIAATDAAPDRVDVVGWFPAATGERLTLVRGVRRPACDTRGGRDRPPGCGAESRPARVQRKVAA